MTRDIAIVGGGASGVLAAIHLLRAADGPFKIILFEPSLTIGEGIAYRTRRAEHLLNVSAARMSAFENDPTHFTRYLSSQERGLAAETIATTFVERRRYGAYLRACLSEAQRKSAATLDVVHDEIVTLDAQADVRLIGRTCRTTHARAAILALGNWPRPLPAADSSSAAGHPAVQAWDFERIATIGADEDIVIVGAGLSMVDVLLTLSANRHRGAIHVVSRHALFPLSHVAHGRAPINIDVLTRLPLSKRVALLRVSAAQLIEQGEPWQWVMDSVRPFVTRLWQSLDARAQRQFLRHAVRFWDVHRHRIAPEAAAVVAALRDSGRVIAHEGRVERIVAHGSHWLVDIAGRGKTPRSTSCIVHRIVNCTGMQSDIARVPNALVGSLIERGFVRAGRHGIGFDTDAGGALISKQGSASESLFALGSVRIGQLWESVAIPELRVQAEALARRIIDAGDAARIGATFPDGVGRA